MRWTDDVPRRRVPIDVLDDGSLVISPEQQALFGDGDVHRGRKELRLMISMQRGDRKVFNGPTPRPENVRIAGPKDEAAVFELLKLDLAINAEKYAPIDDERVQGHIAGCTRRQGGICGVIDGPEGKPIAVTILYPFQWWWSKHWYLFEIVAFVHPDHQRSHNIDALLNFQRWASDEWTRQFGYRVPLLCGVLGAQRIRAKIMLYRRKFTQVGAAFLYPSPFDGAWK